MKYFAYDPETGFELFSTAEEAEEYAQSAIDMYREEASEGWPESVDGVCWGMVKQSASERTYNAVDDEDPGKEYADYQLEDVE